ncbi:hypothetical protein F5Y15DRAFT_86637 [Xylariaceae sp. FL0016]|nr:hypothetical protein F5Y15DRAFT_86637 [Xylariaceae sp. FL0016]
MHLPAPEPQNGDFFITMNVTQDFTPGIPEAQPHRPQDDISLDSRRIQAQHSTVGYREGITAGKAESIQAGFDQGFSLGASIGLRVGQILGLLEGLAAAVPDDAHVRQLLFDARQETDLNTVFGPEYWTPDGRWKYEVDSSEVEHVASRHPLIAKWSRLVEAEEQRWNISRSLPILDGFSSTEEVKETKAAVPDNPTGKPIDW